LFVESVPCEVGKLGFVLRGDIRTNILFEEFVLNTRSVVRGDLSNVTGQESILASDERPHFWG
jgi:hypothetical protein